MYPLNTEPKSENDSRDVIITKFDGIDYLNTFAKSISTMHELIKGALFEQIFDEDVIIDIGGGPGMGARIIEELGKKAVVINIEPSSTIHDVPGLSKVEYIPLKMSFEDALNTQIPYTADCLLMVSSAHEIALCSGMSSQKNKKKFLGDLNTFINKNLKQNGTIIIGFPNYLQGASQEKIDRQRRLTESLLGHSHPPDEFFTVEEFSSAFGTQPVSFYQRHMYLTPDKPEDTILISNVAVFIHQSAY